MCQDVYGAWGKSAVVLIRQLAHRAAHRFGIPPAHMRRRVFLRLLAQQQRRVADLLLLNLE
jgi:hypothetical protein